MTKGPSGVDVLHCSVSPDSAAVLHEKQAAAVLTTKGRVAAAASTNIDRALDIPYNLQLPRIAELLRSPRNIWDISTGYAPQNPRPPFFFGGRGEFGSPPNAWFLGYTRVHNPDGSSIDLSAFVEFTVVTDTQVQAVASRRGPRCTTYSGAQVRCRVPGPSCTRNKNNENAAQ